MGKASDAGKDWRQKETFEAEDEMVRGKYYPDTKTKQRHHKK